MIELDFTKQVGDPFIEISRIGVIKFCDKKVVNYRDLKQCIEELFKKYVYKNTKTLNQIFSDNSKFTHNSTAKNLNKRFQNAMEYFEKIMSENIDGYCISCGEKDNLSKVEKMLFPLTSGEKNVNFTSFFSGDILLCKKCAISLFFLPLVTKKVAWGRAIIRSNNDEINEFWVEDCNEEFNNNMLKNKEDILPNSTINIFENFAYDMIERLKDEDLIGDVSFYLFSNVDRNTQVEILNIFKNQISFIKQVAPLSFKNELPSRQKDEWRYLIFKYASKDRKEGNKKVKLEDEIQENTKYIFRYYNPLIRDFIQGESILRYLRESRVSWLLTEIYAKEILKMREERLKVIKKVANGLLKLKKEDDKEFIKKVVFPIEKTKSANELRTRLREFMRKLLALPDKPKLFSADEMVFYILPSGENWQETKDILLIALYEHLSFDEEIERELETIEGVEDEI